MDDFELITTIKELIKETEYDITPEVKTNYERLYEYLGAVAALKMITNCRVDSTMYPGGHYASITIYGTDVFIRDPQVLNNVVSSASNFSICRNRKTGVELSFMFYGLKETIIN